jgi:predicted kinase
MPRKLILINGEPGSGKTTLKHRLQKDLGLPAISKDDFKEFLFDVLGMPASTEWSRALGRVSSVDLNTTVEVLLDQGYDVIAESAFVYEFAHPDLKPVVERTGAQVLELYCRCEPDVRRKRFDTRQAAGIRHIVHNDTVNELTDAEIAKRYAPLGLGEILNVDTSEHNETAYGPLLERVRAFIKETT